MSQCSRPMNAAKAAQRKLAYYRKKEGASRLAAATVLFQLCTQLDASLVELECSTTDDHGIASPLDEEAFFKAVLIEETQAVTDTCAAGGGADDYEAAAASVGERAAGFAQGG
eukprot:TRINITY_DN14211_c0_g1_i1.p3 TRINITY_DN14211_c0_g1~~TRINITY_DN14211_c0_g1_i1.p3  ORF type:complete len:113 (+),score=24.14 TRINITY_DN14211_c0_g1_i1:486-824(+)